MAAKRPDKIKTRYWKTKCSAIICPTDIFRKKFGRNVENGNFQKKNCNLKKIVKINFNQASDSHDTGKLFSIFGQFFFLLLLLLMKIECLTQIFISLPRNSRKKPGNKKNELKMSTLKHPKIDWNWADKRKMVSNLNKRFYSNEPLSTDPDTTGTQHKINFKQLLLK